MNRRQTEAGPLRVFQLFAGIQLGLLVVTSISLAANGDSRAYHSTLQLLFMLAITATLLVYLLLPGFRRTLGAGFLPLAIGLSLCAPLLGQGLLVLERHPFPQYLGVTTELALFSLFPLLAAGWRYDFRIVATLAVMIGVADYGLTRLAYPTDAASIEYERVVLTRTLGFLAIGFVLSRLMHQQRAHHAALRRANTSLSHYAATLEQLAVSRERERLARELHDTLAHTLSGLAVQLEGVRALLAAAPDGSEPAARRGNEPATVDGSESAQNAGALLAQALTTTRAGLVDTRRALHDLRAAPLEERGLSEAIRRYAWHVAERCGAELGLELPERLPPQPPDIEQTLYRIAQEALENVAAHASARRIHVRLCAGPDQVQLAVVDDGCGFDPESVAADHLGLRGMRERAELAGGKVTVASGADAGTAVTLIVPNGTHRKENAGDNPGTGL